MKVNIYITLNDSDYPYTLLDQRLSNYPHPETPGVVGSPN